jgi:hypothetical protein
MHLASAVPAFSFLLVMLVLILTGTAWFTAMHPGFIWRITLGARYGKPASWQAMLALRIGGILVGAAGLAFLFLSDT